MAGELRPWPFNGYARGSYSCSCSQCDQLFLGDKRAVTCLECAILMTKEVSARNEALETIERDIRIAIWNACRWQGKPQEVAQSFIRYVMDEPCMVRALAALKSTDHKGRGEIG